MNTQACGARSLRLLSAAICGFAVGLATPASGQTCDPGWSDRWSYSSFATSVQAGEYFDFGNGPQLVVAGSLSMPAMAVGQRVVRLTPGGWVGMTTGIVGIPSNLRVLDLGQGPRLFTTGNFTTSAGIAGNLVAVWDGSGWSGLGNPGVPRSDGATLAVFDDGTGPALFLAPLSRSFSGPVPLRRWDGVTWQTAATFSPGTGGAWLTDLRVLDLGGGPELYAAGSFTAVDGVPAQGVARFNGTRWEAVGSALSGWVATLEVHDDGTGRALYAGGPITLGRHNGRNPVVKLVGGQWAPVGTIPGTSTGSAGRLCSTGSTLWAILGSSDLWYEQGLARLESNGTWRMIRTGSVTSLTAVPDGSGDVLFTGSFDSMPDADIPYVARHDGTSSSPVEAIGMGASTAYSAASVRVGSETRMYVADSRGVFRVDHGRNERLQSIPGSDILAGDFGRGPELFIRSSLRRVDLTSGEVSFLPQLPGQGATYISFLKYPYNGREQPAVVAQASSGSAALVYCWDGSAWIRMPGAFGGSPPVRLSVIAPQLSGWPELVAAGNFTSVDGQPIRSLAAYRDGAWQAIAGAPTAALGGAIMRHDPSGPKLVVAGRNAYTNRVGVWDGAAWTTELVQVLPHVLTRFDDGGGPAIYALGSGVAVFRDGRWTYPNTRISGDVEFAYGADAPDGGSLFVMGTLTKVADKVSRSVAEYVGCPTTCRADLNADGSADFSDYLDFADAFSRGLPIADFHADGFLDYFDFAEFLSALDGGCQ